jgi:hypothetical protein
MLATPGGCCCLQACRIQVKQYFPSCHSACRTTEDQQGAVEPAAAEDITRRGPQATPEALGNLLQALLVQQDAATLLLARHPVNSLTPQHTVGTLYCYTAVVFGQLPDAHIHDDGVPEVQ